MISKEKKRKQLTELLGDLPAWDRKIDCIVISEQEEEFYILEKLLLDLNGTEPVPAYFTKPKKMTKPAPAILYNHAHGGDYELGKDELIIGRKSLQSPPYARMLAEMGVSALCIDAWGFGERRGRTETQIFKQMLWNGQVMWGMMVYDSLKAVEYIASRPDTDINRIGTIGLSMGSTMAWWVSALETRINVCIDICCMTDYQSLIDANGLDGHSIYYYVPGLIKHFSTTDINALIAPRAHLSINGMYDLLTPLAGLKKIDAQLQKVYKDENAEDAWKLSLYHVGHLETAAMRAEVSAFIKKWL